MPQQILFDLRQHAAGQRQFKRGFRAGGVARPLLDRDRRPAQIGRRFPISDGILIDSAARRFLIACVEVRPVRQPPGLPFRLPEPPRRGAEPSQILHRIGPAGELPVDDGGQPSPVDHVVSRPVIPVAQHQLTRRRRVQRQPA